MSEVLRRNRKGSDRDITRLNSLGFCLKAIAKKFTCHPTSISLRLSSLEIEPADTRRAFMESIYKNMEEPVIEQLADHLENSGIQIRDYVKGLIEADMDTHRTQSLLAPALSHDSIIIDLTQFVIQ